jgi:2-polyprenyl-6-methoxyphenol hydroxylase-like FAD-dependent oxidoreductase
MIFGQDSLHSLPICYSAYIATSKPGIDTGYVQFGRGLFTVTYRIHEAEFGGILIFDREYISKHPMEINIDDVAQLLHKVDNPVVEALARSEDHVLFSDEAFLVRLPAWTQKRVVLTGDAAYSLSPASGFGGVAAMAGAYILAEEITKHGLNGLTTYERRLRPFIEARQKKASRIAKQIGSQNPLFTWIRDKMLRLAPDKAFNQTGTTETLGIA